MRLAAVRLLKSARGRISVRSGGLQARYASTNMTMPAMSPTMTEGGIASWKVKAGDRFAAGDVLLEVETDKATIDVESQEDGVLGKIIVEAGAQKIPVGQVIAVLVEEGDDLAAIEVPSGAGLGSGSASASAKTETEAGETEKKGKEGKMDGEGGREQRDERVQHEHKVIKHAKPLFPSVSRLLQSCHLSSEEISQLKGTGRHGMLTKGDVLLALGKVKSAYGSAEKLNVDVMGASGRRKSENEANAPETARETAVEALDGLALRRLIVAGMARATCAQAVEDKTGSRESDVFESILAPYASLLPSRPDVGMAESRTDEWAGMF